MKKTNNTLRIFLTILAVAFIGTVIVECANLIFGIYNVFAFSVIVVLITGIFVVPYLQYKNYKRGGQ